jgi:CheY-like chemotaxis protein
MTSVPETTQGRTILVADDNPQILELLEAYLEPLSPRVVMASDGLAALEAVAAHVPDIILLDVMMPRKSGFEVCRELKSDDRYKSIPIILVTALNEAGDMEHARECGADAFLTKPVNKIELIKRVEKLLSGAVRE